MLRWLFAINNSTFNVRPDDRDDRARVHWLWLSFNRRAWARLYPVVLHRRLILRCCPGLHHKLSQSTVGFGITDLCRNLDPMIGPDWIIRLL